MQACASAAHASREMIPRPCSPRQFAGSALPLRPHHRTLQESASVGGGRHTAFRGGPLLRGTPREPIAARAGRCPLPPTAPPPELENRIALWHQPPWGGCLSHRRGHLQRVSACKAHAVKHDAAPCAAEFKAQAAELVRRKTKPADLIADDRAPPHDATLVARVRAEASRGAVCRPGRLRADGHRVGKLQRTVRDSREKNTIGTKPGASPAAAGGMGSVHPRPPLGLLGRAEVPNLGLPKRVLRVAHDLDRSPGLPRHHTRPPGSP